MTGLEDGFTGAGRKVGWRAKPQCRSQPATSWRSPSPCCLLCRWRPSRRASMPASTPSLGTWGRTRGWAAWTAPWRCGRAGCAAAAVRLLAPGAWHRRRPKPQWPMARAHRQPACHLRTTWPAAGGAGGAARGGAGARCRPAAGRRRGPVLRQHVCAGPGQRGSGGQAARGARPGRRRKQRWAQRGWPHGCGAAGGARTCCCAD